MPTANCSMLHEPGSITKEKKVLRLKCLLQKLHLPPRWEVRGQMNLETKKKPDGWNHAHVDGMMEGGNRQLRSSRSKISPLLVTPILEQRLAASDEACLVDNVRGIKFEHFDATEGTPFDERDCFGKDISPGGSLPFRKEDSMALDAANEKELMGRTFYVSKNATVHSQPISDSFSGLPTNDSASLSSKNEMNLLANGKLATPILKSDDFSSDCMGGGSSQLSCILSVKNENTCDARQEFRNKGHLLYQEVNCGQLQLQRDYLDFKFPEERIVENHSLGKGTNTAALTKESKTTKLQQATECHTKIVDVAFGGGSKLDLVDKVSLDGEGSSGLISSMTATLANVTEFQHASYNGEYGGGSVYDIVDRVNSDGEWGSSLASSTFYSASACSPDCCSDRSQHLDEADKQDNNDVNVGYERSDGAENKHGIAVEASESMVYVQINKIPKTFRKESHFQIYSKEASVPQADLPDPNNITDKLLAESKVKPWRTFPCIDAKPYFPLFLHGDVVLKNEMKFPPATIAAWKKLSLQSEASHGQDRLTRHVVDKFLSTTALDGESPSNHDLYDSASSLSCSPMHQSPIDRHNNSSRPPFETVKGGHGSCGLYRTMSSGFDWRLKRRSASVGNSSTVRALESAFVGSRTKLHPKRDLLAIQTTENINSEELVSRIPSRKWREPVTKFSRSPLRNCQNPIDQHRASLSMNFVQQQRITSGCASQVNTNVKYEPSLNAIISALSANKILSLNSDIDVPYARNYFVSRSMPNPIYRKLSSELEVSCNPFISVPKSIRYSPGLESALSYGRYPTAAMKTNDNASKHSNTAQKGNSPTIMHGHLRQAYRDGFPIYTFLLENSEDVLIARGCTSEDCSDKQDYNWMYTFHSRRSRAKVGWKTWGRKGKAAADFAGQMKVYSVLHPEVTSSGEITQSVESEFILFNGSAQGTAQCQRDMSRHQPSHLSYIKPDLNSSRGFRLSVPAACPSPSTIPRQHVSEKTRLEHAGSHLRRGSPIKARLGHRPSLSQDVWRDLDLPDVEPGFLRSYPSHMELAAILINTSAGAQELPSGSQKVSKETGGWGLNFLDESSEGSTNLEARDKNDIVSLTAIEECIRQGQFMWTDEENYLKGTKDAASDTKNNLLTSNENMVQRNIHEDTHPLDFIRVDRTNIYQQGTREKTVIQDNFFTGNEKLVEGNYYENIHSSGLTDGPNRGKQARKSANVTIILPRGNHGLPSVESSGPSPLIERWKTGGKCDCGGWDLGCGLTILSTERSFYNTHESMGIMKKEDSTGLLPATKPLRIFSQGSRQDMLVVSLEVIQDRFFSLSFHDKLSELQAFAIAVAILHSTEALASIGLKNKVNQPDNVSSQVPLKPLKLWPNLSRSGSKSRDGTILSPQFFEDFDVQYPPELPVSPFGRV